MSINSMPWSQWRLTGDTSAAGVETPFKRDLPRGLYTLTLTEPQSGSVKSCSLRIRGGV